MLILYYIILFINIFSALITFSNLQFIYKIHIRHNYGNNYDINHNGYVRIKYLVRLVIFSIY